MTRRPLTSAVLLPLVLASIGFAQISHRAEFATMRMIDIVQLMGIGVCIGVAMFATILMLKGKSISD